MEGSYYSAGQILTADGSGGDIRELFTQLAINSLASFWPQWNILIYHNQHSGYIFYYDIHVHYELVTGAGTTYGYEVHLFDRGAFILSGDGGFINWCFAGNFTRQREFVKWFSMGVAPGKLLVLNNMFNVGLILN